MEHLSRQQIVLLAVLISFVTSLATGIVTVTLMDQSPAAAALPRTITQVIQKSVAGVPIGATSTAAVAVAVSDQVADATEYVMPSIVRLRDGDRGEIAGLGLLVSANGAVMTDKDLTDTLDEPQAVFGNGSSAPLSLTRFQKEGDIAFLEPVTPISLDLKTIRFGNHVRMGQSVWTLSGTSSYELAQGIIASLEGPPDFGKPIINSSIRTAILPGAPLFDATGGIVGIYAGRDDAHGGRSFYAVAAAKGGVPK